MRAKRALAAHLVLSLYGDNFMKKVQKRFCTILWHCANDCLVGGLFSWGLHCIHCGSKGRITVRHFDGLMAWGSEGKEQSLEPRDGEAEKEAEIFCHAHSHPTRTPQGEAWGIDNSISLFSLPLIFSLRLCIASTQQEAQWTRKAGDRVYISQPFRQKSWRDE